MKVVDPADCLTDTAVADTERMMWSMNLDVVHWRPADWPRSAGGGEEWQEGEQSARKAICTTV